MFRLLKYQSNHRPNYLPLLQRFLSQANSVNFHNLPANVQLQFKGWRSNLINSVKTSDFFSAEKIYLEVRNQEDSLAVNRASLLQTLDVYSMFLSICNKKHHLSHVNHILRFLERYELPKTEQCFFPLIRCYSDMNDDAKILDLLRQMRENQIALRYRNFQPLFALYFRNKNLAGFINAVRLLEEASLPLKSHELSMLLRIIDEERRITQHNYERNHLLKQQVLTVNNMLRKISDSLLGMDSLDMINVICKFTDATIEEIKDGGILVRSKDDVPRHMSQMDRYEEDGSFVALNATYHRHSQIFTNKRNSTDSREFMQFVPVRFIDSTKRDEIERMKAKEGESAFARDPTSARLVQISNKQSTCPHCKSELAKLYITEEQRALIRDELYAVGTKRDTMQVNHFDEFETWLADKDFDYIIDGANVAYNSQNYNADLGRFSYKQIEIVVEKVLEMDKRPLVILPSCYGKPGTFIPNSIGSRSMVHRLERKFLSKLEAQGMLYVVPERINDDLYLILASIHRNVKKMVYVVTNDQLRDHRDRFIESLSFYRWRTAHVVNFMVNREWNMTTSGGNSSVTDMQIPGESYFYFPADCSRAIQYTERTGRWHIPSLDSDFWLCVDFNPFKTATVKI